MLDLNIDASAVDSACDETDPFPSPIKATPIATTAATFFAEHGSGASSSVLLIPDEESNSSSTATDRHPQTATLKFSILKTTDVIQILDDDQDDYVFNNHQVLMTRQLFPVPHKQDSFPLLTTTTTTTTTATTTTRPQQWLELSVPDVAAVEIGGIYNKDQPLQHQQQVGGGRGGGVKKSRRGPRSRSSQYRGVTFYRRTGRWESHIWFVFLNFSRNCKISSIVTSF